MADPNYRLKLSVRLFSGADKCFGPGVAELLERIDTCGSLRTAAAEMGMAYSNAWTTLRGCEAALGFPLLERAVGGAKGGSSTLTPRGRTLLEGYRKLEHTLGDEGARLLASLLPSE